MYTSVQFHIASKCTKFPFYKSSETETCSCQKTLFWSKFCLTHGNNQGLKYLKIGTCPASQKLLAYMGKKIIFTRNIKFSTCPAA